ncbi:MAG: 7,8-didemethyl-8-hydroxy-5-deazariboflavin synthase CofG, partial [Rhodospirillaceae bacterium]
MAEAARLRDAGHGDRVTFSKNVFIPLTHLCRDVCHYYTFAEAPKRGESPYMSRDAVLDVVRRAAQAGCTEALFTLGDKPERRYARAREALADLGHATTVGYLAEMAEAVQRETGLLAHVNPGVMTADDIRALRRVSVSQGLMVESLSERLCARGGPHFGSPDKRPAARLETVRLAGKLAVPFTSGLLIGIGETCAERLETLVVLRDLHAAHGHVQEIIVQNFKPKPGTRMADAPPAPADELLWTIAVARLVFGPEMNIQAPPNLVGGDLAGPIAAGINDWGGVSPVTPDYVNPEAPWPAFDALARATAAAGKTLVERLGVYPAYVRNAGRWLDDGVWGGGRGEAEVELHHGRLGLQLAHAGRGRHCVRGVVGP